MEAKTNEEFFNVSALIDERFGKEGTVTRAEAEEKAYAFYTGQIIEDARKKAKITHKDRAEDHHEQRWVLVLPRLPCRRRFRYGRQPPQKCRWR